MTNNTFLCLRVSFHKAHAFLALRDKENLSRRLARYNHHMSKARSLALPDTSSTVVTGVRYE